MPADPALISWRNFRSVGGTIAAAFGTFGFFAIQGVLLARLLGPQGRGEFATVVAYSQTFLYLGLLGAAEIFARLAANLGNDADDASVRRSALRYGLLTGSITGSVCVLLAWIALPEGKQYLAPLAMLAGVTVPLQHMRLSVQGVDHGLGNFNRYNIVRIGAAAILPILLLVLWLADLKDLKYPVYAFVVSAVLAALFCQWGMRGSWFGPAQQSVRESLVQGKGLAWSQIWAEVLDRADVFLILWIGTLTEQGLYASAIPVASTMIIVPNAIGLYSFRRGADEMKPLSTTGVTKLVGLVFVCQIVAGAILAFLIPFAVPILYTDAFEGTIRFAWYLLPAAGLRGLLMATDAYLRGQGTPMPGIVGRIVAIVLLVVIAFAFKQQVGTLIIPIALGIAQFACVVVVVSAMYRGTKAVVASDISH